MSTPYRQCATTVQRLYGCLLELERAASLLKLQPLQGREWFELLRQKLLAQLSDDAFLVVAVVGGTNIGKSVVFNHIACSRASATSPLASGTKHPICLVPRKFTNRHSLEAIFEGFALHQWTRADAALEDHPEHRLYWQVSGQVPSNLLVLDTPDIDSDARVNWERADHVRRCADVLIAVLTQQKYNDAAVKQFFRKAAAEDKAVIVVFNQCELPEDDRYWPLWLETFCDETGISPEFVYIAPTDRRAAEETRLPFYERRWPPGTVPGETGNGDEQAAPARSLSEDLSRLRFGDVKLQSLRGSLRQVLDADLGVPAYLLEVEQRGAEFLSAASRLSSESVVKVRDWPAVPNKLLIAEIREWWKSRQEGWAKQVHGFYDAIGAGAAWPFRRAREILQGKKTDPWDVYQRQEWSSILNAVEELFDKLSLLSESGSPLLKPHFEKLLAGTSRAELLERLRERHADVDFAAELQDVVSGGMQDFQTDSPELYRFYKQLNNISAAVRPVTSVVLFTMGWGPAGELVAPVVANAAAHTLMPIVADFAGGTAAAVAGESALSGAAGHGSGYLQAKFRRLHGSFTARRAAWLVSQLKHQLLGALPEQLQAASEIPTSHEFRNVVEALSALEAQWNAEHEKTVA